MRVLVLLNLKLKSTDMCYLFFDTETTGFLNKTLPLGSPLQSRCCQLAALVTDDKGVELGRMNRIIKPNGWLIPANVSLIHGITNEMAFEKGVPMKQALAEFELLLKITQLLIGHNFPFDDGIMRNEFATEDHATNFINLPFVCTMQEMTPICQLPKSRGTGFKWPKLSEAYFHCFKKEIIGAHDAMIDLTATKEVFFWIKEREEAERAAGLAAMD